MSSILDNDDQLGIVHLRPPTLRLHAGASGDTVWRPMNARIVSLLLFVSGLAALVLQTAWLREFRLIFGASTPASAAVLAAFMGGLGLGNLVLGRWADCSASPLRLYAQLEAAVSVTSALTPLLVVLVRAIYIAIGGQETLGLVGATLLRLICTALVLGPSTFLMGGTLPAAARAITLSDDMNRRGVGLLYGLNTFGAVAGAVLSTFVLLEWLGTRATLWAACGVNLLNAIAAWKLAGASQESGARGQESVASDTDGAPVEGSVAPLVAPHVVYVIAAVVGFAFFLMELVWYRMLGPILGGTTFTFGLILAVALAGIGIGSALYPLVFRERRPDVRWLALTLAGEALAIAVPIALGDRIAALAWVLEPLSSYGFIGQVFGWLVICKIVVLPAAVISGLQFPLLIALVGQGSRDVGQHVGRMTAFSTVGSIAGSLAGGFGLMWLLTAPGVWRLAVIVLAAAATILVCLDFHLRRRLGSLLLPLGGSFLAAVCLLATGPTAVWRHSGIGAGRAAAPHSSPNEMRAWMNTTRRNIVWEADGRESSVAISGNRGIGFVVNGKSDGNAVSDVGTQIMLGTLGVLLHPGPKSGLVIGLGTGESAGWLAHQPAIERVEVVEIEPAIGHVAEVCGPLNHDVMRHSKVQVIYGDARELLLTTRSKYDLIASEPSNPYRSGVSSLYTREFYTAVRERLRPGGMFLQWLQGYEIDVATFRTVVRTLREAFGHVEIWETHPADMVLVCSQQPPEYDASDLRRRMAEPAMKETLRVAWRTMTLEGVVAHLVATDRFSAAVAEDDESPINTDDNNRLEFRFARLMGLAGGFSVSRLRAEASSFEAQRPPRLREEVDWEAVEDARIAYHAAADYAPLSPSEFSGARARRAQALLTFQRRTDLAGVSRIWDSQPKAPTDLTEIIAVALGHAARADERALALAESIREECPIESDVIEAILAARKNNHEQAARFLTRALKAMRSDATVMPLVAEYALSGVMEVAQNDPQQMRPLYEALSEPLALLIAQEHRQAAACILGQQLGPRELAAALEPMEPYPTWTGSMLEARVEAYKETGSPYLARARRELAEYQRYAPEESILRGREP
jgi:spermidine synthase